MSEHATDDLNAAYARLRRIANKLMSHERVGHTLSATEVVHEAIARLLESGFDTQQAVGGERFVQFVRHSAHAMTQVLIDHARQRGALKRGGGRRRVELDDMEAVLDAPSFDWIGLDTALEELRVHDPRRHSVVLLRFFAGLDNRQIAEQLGVDERTVSRDWASSKLWLRQRLGDKDGSD